MSLEMNLSRKEQKEYEQWLREMQETVRLEPIREETDEQKGRRKASLLKNFTKFCRYYFEDFMDADFAWFHKKRSWPDRRKRQHHVRRRMAA